MQILTSPLPLAQKNSPSRDFIVQMLNQNNVPWQTWKSADDSTLDRLVEYVDATDAHLRTVNGTLIIYIGVAVAQLYHPRRGKILYQRKVFYNATNEKVRRAAFGIATVIRRNEPPREAVKRAIKDHFAFDNPDDYWLSGPKSTYEDNLPLRYWPGINFAFRNTVYYGAVGEHAYRRRGYKSKFGKPMYFHWIKDPNFPSSF